MNASRVATSSVTHDQAATNHLNKHTLFKPVVICGNFWIGSHAFVGSGVAVGSNSVVAAGPVVVRDVPSKFIVAAGVPARVIRGL